MLSHGCNQQQGCTNRHLGQNLAHGNTETVQKNIQGSNLLSCLVSSDAWLYSYLPWIRKDPLHLLTEGQCTGKVLFNRSDCELGRKRNAGGKEWLWVWSQWKRKFRLIILCGCEKSLFNNNMSETNHCNFALRSHKHNATAARTAFTCTISLPGQKYLHSCLWLITLVISFKKRKHNCFYKTAL